MISYMRKARIIGTGLYGEAVGKAFGTVGNPNAAGG